MKENAVLSESEAVGKDLLQSFLDEVKFLTKPWGATPQSEQKEVLDRWRNRIQDNVRRIVNVIASEGRDVIVCDLDSIKIKDGIVATLKISAGNESGSLNALYGSTGSACLLMVKDSTAHTVGMHDIKPEPDQRAMDLGQEYDASEPEGDLTQPEFSDKPEPLFKFPRLAESSVIDVECDKPADEDTKKEDVVDPD
jgi:hypothetical protein